MPTRCCGGWKREAGGRRRFIATLFSLFAVLALGLAATGLYSVVSFAVTQRTQEVGIRMALGAPRTSIIRLVLASTGTMLGFGLALGLALQRGAEQSGSVLGKRKPPRPAHATSLRDLVAPGSCSSLRSASLARRHNRPHARPAHE